MPINKNKIITAAQKFIQRGAYDKAIREYQKIVDDDPKDVRTLLKIGDLYAKNRDPASAAETYERVANAYSAQGFYLKAVAVYKQILKVEPTRVEVNRKLAELYHQLGLLSDCMTQYQTLAAHYERAGKVGETVRIFERMVELDPENVASRVKLAELYSREGRSSEGIREFERACEQLQAQGRTDDYIKVAERLLFLDHTKIPEARRLARVYLRRGDTKRALAKLQLCFKADPRDIETLELLADAFLDLEQHNKTVSVLKELSKIYDEKGMTTERDEVWRRVMAHAPDDPDARAALSSSAAAKPPLTAVGGDSSEAIDKILSETDVYLKYGLFQKARDHLEQLFRVSPENAKGLERLETACRELGDNAGAVSAALRWAEAVHVSEPQRAREILDRAHSLDPGNAEVNTRLRELARSQGKPSLKPTTQEFVAFQPNREPGSAEIIIVDEGDDAHEDTTFGMPPAMDVPPPVQRAGPDDVSARPVLVIPPVENDGEEMELDAEDFVEEIEVIDVAETSVALDEPEPEPPESDDRTVVAAIPEMIAAERDVAAAKGPQPGARSIVVPPTPEPAAEGRSRSDEDVEGELEEADFFTQQGLYEEARLILRELVRARPERDDIREKLRAVEAELGDEEPSLASSTPIEGAEAVEVDEVFEELSTLADEGVGVEDSETHYDLGIAYKEMGLLDDAIHEFTQAMRVPARELSSLERIAACLIEKGQFNDAIRELKRGLASPRITDVATIDFYFGMGRAYEGLGDDREALYYYRRVSNSSKTHRDVQERIDLLTERLSPAPGSSAALRR